jgi:hypothetical protein
MSTHTPGPWKVGDEVDSSKHLVYIRVESLTSNVSTVGVYGRKPNGDTAGEAYTDKFGTERYKPVITATEARANARLIAAAPELLEALNRMLVTFVGDETLCMECGEPTGTGETCDTCYVIGKAIEAIRKAKGESLSKEGARCS